MTDIHVPNRAQARDIAEWHPISHGAARELFRAADLAASCATSIQTASMQAASAVRTARGHRPEAEAEAWDREIVGPIDQARDALKTAYHSVEDASEALEDLGHRLYLTVDETRAARREADEASAAARRGANSPSGPA